MLSLSATPVPLSLEGTQGARGHGPEPGEGAKGVRELSQRSYRQKYQQPLGES